MAERLLFDDREAFLAKLAELVREGVPPEKIDLITPFPVPEADRILPPGRSRVRIFAFAGAASGTAAGFAFTILTTLSWPLIIGGKPMVSIPPFLIIAFALTILFGALSTFFGFLLLSRLPSIRRIRSQEEYGNRFVIVVEKGEGR